MDYQVRVSERAKRDIEDDFQYVQAHAPESAVRWRYGIEQKVLSLRAFPSGFGLAPENDHEEAELRQTLFGRWRILFIVEAEIVYVLTIRHSARDLMSASEIKRLLDGV